MSNMENEQIENDGSESGGNTEAADRSIREEIELASQELDGTSDEAREESAAEARERDEKGRFKAKNSEEVVEQSAKLETVTDIQKTTPENKDGKAPEPIPAPVSWSSEDKAYFETLPPEIKQVIVKRESDREKFLSQKSGEAAQVSRQWEPINQILQPHRQELALQGWSDSQYVNYLIAGDKLIQNDPKAAIMQIAHNHGLSIESLIGEQPQVDPVMAQTQAELNSIKAHLQQQEQARAQMYHLQKQQAVVSFAQETDESGNPRHPHFRAVEEHMLPIIGVIRQAKPNLSDSEVLKEAYDQAVWANPSVRTQMLTKQQEEAKQKRMTEEKVRVEAAKRAGSSVVGSPNGTTQAAPGSLREQLEQAFQQY